MKILYDYAAFVVQTHGGISRVMCELIRRELARPDVEGRVFAGFHKNFELHQLGREFPGKIREWMLPPTLVRQRVFMPVNRALFVPFARRFAPDICHHTFFKTPPVPGKTKVVITVHDLIVEIFAQEGEDPQAKDRRRALEKADGIICVSENTKTDLHRFYDLGNKPVLVAHHGNSLHSVSASVPQVARPYFLYVGTRDAGYKNFQLLLETFSRCQLLQPYGIVCFGGGPFTRKELDAIKTANLAGRVHHRQGPDRELAGYYQNATALIYPSRYEGFGLPPIEAMGFGCPVLASFAPPLPEIIGPAALFFDPGSGADLVRAITRLLTEAGVREALIERGKQREQLFSWDETSLKIHDFYRALLGQ